MRIYQLFQKGIPEYLARHYWWAYLWRPAIWFFDHQFIINLILFGQYKRLLNAALDMVPATDGETLQLTCAYGHLTPKLLEKLDKNKLYIIDVAQQQLLQARKKVNVLRLIASRMNAEKLAFKNQSFDTVIVFFLLHELPEDVREKVLSELLRVVKNNGILVFVDYSHAPVQHILYRLWIFRTIITKLEPFLASLWKVNIDERLALIGRVQKKELTLEKSVTVFNGFYFVKRFSVKQLS